MKTLISTIWWWASVGTLECIFLHLSHMNLLQSVHLNFMLVPASQSSQGFGVCASSKSREFAIVVCIRRHNNFRVNVSTHTTHNKGSTLWNARTVT
jgi:hypothetical protein